jgi:ribosome-associated toxin RatA of RatAB toxin-antitoxin module
MATAAAVISATKEQVFAVLSDYQSYSDWTADVAESTILAQDAASGVVWAEFFSPELMGSRYQLELTVISRPNELEFHQIDIDREPGETRGLTGRWRITEAAGGLRVDGEMNLKRGFWKQRADEARARLVLQRRLDALQQMFAPASEAATETGLLPSIQGEDELAVWILGQRYLLRKSR